MSVKIGNKILSSTEYSYVLGLGLSGKTDKVQGYLNSIPEVSIYAKRPMRGEIPELNVYGKRPVQRPPQIYTPPGGGNWSYNAGADMWFSNVDRDAQGKPLLLPPEEYEKQYPNQLRQAGYREMFK